MTLAIARVIAALPVGLIASPAVAHHAMDGATPTTLMQGVLSGLAHPVIGLDHLAFLIALGLLVPLLSRPAVPATAFIAGSWVGVLACVAWGAPSTLEWLVATTVLGGGLVLLMTAGRPSMSWEIALPFLLSAVGVVHGLAFGESIVGSEPTVLSGYLAGLTVVQGVLVAAVGGLASRLTDTLTGAPLPLRVAGAAVAAVGVVNMGLLFVAP